MAPLLCFEVLRLDLLAPAVERDLRCPPLAALLLVCALLPLLRVDAAGFDLLPLRVDAAGFDLLPLRVDAAGFDRDEAFVERLDALLEL